MRQAKLRDIVERQRNGTWDGIPRGMRIVVDSEGNDRLHRNAAVDVPEKSFNCDDDEGIKESSTLLTLGSPKTTRNKSSSDDEGLGDALADLLSDEGNTLSGKDSVSPLPLLGGDEDDPNNAVDYSEDDPNNAVDYDGTDDEYLDTFDGGQASIEHERAPAMYDESLQSQDEQQMILSSGTESTRPQSIQPVLTKQGVMDLVSKDAGTLTPNSGWERRKQSYCDMLKGYESPNGTSVRGLVQALWCLAVRVRYLQSDPL